MSKFAYEVKIRVELTEIDITCLSEAANRHYDGICKFAFSVGNFGHGWRNRVCEFEQDHVYASGHDLGTCCKILEIHPPCDLSKRLNEALRELSEEYRRVNGEGY